MFSPRTKYVNTYALPTTHPRHKYYHIKKIIKDTGQQNKVTKLENTPTQRKKMKTGASEITKGLTVPQERERGLGETGLVWRWGWGRHRRTGK